jgi:hypothetical protein
VTDVVKVMQQPTRVVTVARAVGPRGAAGASAYEVWRAQGNAGTQSDYLASLVGTPGTRGAAGTSGTDGREVELQTTTTHVQWRYVGGVWADLVTLISLRGDTGAAGAAGAAGTPGVDGKSVELQVSGGFIQWRLTGGAWTNLIATSFLKGDTGSQGLPGTAGPAGPGVPAGGTAGQVLTKSSGNDYATGWTTPAGAAPVSQTTTLTAVTGTGTVVMAKGFTILTVAYSGAARLRLYRTAAGRTADAARAFTAPYAGGATLIYDYNAVGAETDQERPLDGAWGSGESAIYYNVTGTATITITWVKTAEA